MEIFGTSTGGLGTNFVRVDLVRALKCFSYKMRIDFIRKSVKGRYSRSRERILGVLYLNFVDRKKVEGNCDY